MILDLWTSLFERTIIPAYVEEEKKKHTRRIKKGVKLQAKYFIFLKFSIAQIPKYWRHENEFIHFSLIAVCNL